MRVTNGKVDIAVRSIVATLMVVVAEVEVVESVGNIVSPRLENQGTLYTATIFFFFFFSCHLP